MKLYTTNTCQVLSARTLDDQMLGKALEGVARTLSAAVREVTSKEPPLDLYKAKHPNHKTVQWVMHNRGNFVWAGQYGCALSIEYERRFGKVHASSRIVLNALAMSYVIPYGELEEFLEPKAVVRAMLSARWQNNAASWTKCFPPKWSALNGPRAGTVKARQKKNKQVQTRRRGAAKKRRASHDRV